MVGETDVRNIFYLLKAFFVLDLAFLMPSLFYASEQSSKSYMKEAQTFLDSLQPGLYILYNKKPHLLI